MCDCLHQHRRLSPGSRYTHASLLIRPIVDLVSPLAYPAWLCRRFMRTAYIIYIPSSEAIDVAANRIPACVAPRAWELFVYDSIELRGNGAVVRLVQCSFPD